MKPFGGIEVKMISSNLEKMENNYYLTDVSRGQGHSLFTFSRCSRKSYKGHKNKFSIFVSF